MARDRDPSRTAGEVVDLDDDAWDAPHPRVGHHDDEGDGRPDDDDGDRRAPARTDRAGRPRWLRSRWALPALVLVLVLVVELAAARQFRASAADELARAVQLSAVQLGGASVTSSSTGAPSAWDDAGRLLVDLQVQVLNSGTQPVEVTVRGTTEPLLALVDPPAVASVGPDGANTLVMRAAVDCSKVPRAPLEVTSDTERQRTPLALDADVVVGPPGGDSQRHRYLVADSGWGWGGVADQLTYACDPLTSGTFTVSTTALDDGRMQVDVSNGTRATTTVALEATPWLRASSDVALPSQVAAGSSLTFRLSLDPDCRRARPPSDGGLDSRVDVVTVEQDGSTRLAQYPGSAPTAAWAARQVALACG